ncbi:hypothetical protein SAMN04487967_1384 [Natronorubrum sediminis]|uniref:TRAP transporter solute receptor, TAXI family n=2 Tax=Natronorubrum sediminis TaxID=640943 RepID=A0A1H6FUE0_9EURY|nr:hypothetical protein SAMN04487967_1384 [Natronorubrum sediminis]
MVDVSMVNSSDRRTFIKAVSAGSIAGMTGMAGCLDEIGGGGGDDFVTIATGGTGGVYYTLGGGMADVWADELGLDTSVESTGGSVENGRLLAEDTEVALMMENAIHDAIHAEGDFDEEIPLQALHGAYMNPTHVVVQEDLDVETFDDLEGHSVSIGDLGSATEMTASDIFEFYDMDYDDVDAREYSFDETTDAMIDDQLDAGMYSVGLPGPAVDELFTQADVTFVEFPEEDLEAMSEEWDHYEPHEIPADTYDGQDEAAPNPGVLNTVVVHEDMDEEMANDLTTTIYENIDRLADVHQAADDFEEYARESPTEYHPGGESALDDLDL